MLKRNCASAAGLMIESQLITRCRRGDREAQRELYAQNADRVYRLLLRMTGNPDDASELAQDAFLRVFQHIERFDGRASLGTWIYQIALNEGRQFLRKKERDRAKRTELGYLEAVDSFGPEQARLEMADMLDGLPEEERTLLVLRYFEELSYAEMEEMLGKPGGTVASGLNRARRMLRERLESQNGEKKTGGESIQS